MDEKNLRHLFFWFPILTLLCTIIIGIAQYEGKWHHIGAHHEWTYKLRGENVTCHDKDMGLVAPCYDGLKTEIEDTVLMSNFLPFLPWVLALPFEQKYITVAMYRFGAFLLLLVLFYCYYYPKVLLRHSLGMDFDASDHCGVAVVGLTIAFAEISWHVVDGPGGEPLVFAALSGVIVWVLKTYQTFYTAMYFHTRWETVLGFLVGLLCALIFDRGIYPWVLDHMERAISGKPARPWGKRAADDLASRKAQSLLLA